MACFHCADELMHWLNEQEECEIPKNRIYTWAMNTRPKQTNPRNENNYYEAPVGSAIDEPAPVNPIPDRKAELQGDTIDIEEYIKMVDENEAVENETVGGPEEESQPEEEQGVNHGQDMAGAVPNPVDPDEEDDEEE
jgi:hypothetical protein